MVPCCGREEKQLWAGRACRGNDEQDGCGNGNPDAAAAFACAFRIGIDLVDENRSNGIIAQLLGLTGKQEFLSTDLPGWEYMLALSRKTFLCIQIFLLAAAWTGTVSGGVPGLVMQLLSLGGLALLLAVLLIRSVTSQSLLSSRFESGVIARIKDASFLRPSPAARLSIPSRMVFERICEYMETAQPFLDETFSLDDLARNIYTNKSYVSKVINVCTSMNFPQFLNNYRVRYAMELFRRDPKLRVTELSAMSGFHSTVTFNLAFRLFLNQTPGNWCREYRERIEREKQAPSMKQGPVP